MTEMDAELHIHVNFKNKIGKTENLGQFVFQISEMSRYQPPFWYRLTKKNKEVKERGFIQLEFQFANKFNNSISNFSINKIEKGLFNLTKIIKILKFYLFVYFINFYFFI